MDVLRQDVHMVKKQAAQLRLIALFVVRQRIIFIEVKENHIPETQAFLAMLANELGEDVPRRTTGRKRHHIRLEQLLTLPNLLRNIVRYRCCTCTGVLINSYRQLLHTRYTAQFKHILRTIQTTRHSA